jgi:restriction system protein
VGRRRGFWAELAYQEQQRRKAALQEQQQRLRLEQQELRLEEQRRRMAEQQAARSEREQRRLREQRLKAKAAELTASLEREDETLRTLLASSLQTRPHIDFAELKRVLELPAFDPSQFGDPTVAPVWEEYAPVPYSGLAKWLGSGRYDREVHAARARFFADLTAHEQAERDRRRRVADGEQDHARQLERLREEVARHNAGIDSFQKRFQAGDPEAVAEYFGEVLRRSPYPPGFPQHHRIAYHPLAKQLVVEYQLPDREVVPQYSEYRYVKARDAIEPKRKKDPEIHELYERVVAQVAVRTLHELFAVEAAELVDEVVFNDHVPATNPATGHQGYPCIVSVGATRERFRGLKLEGVSSPRECLRYLNALVSPHPYDHEGVRPVLEFDLTRYKFVNEIDIIAGLDSRMDLLELSPVEFEHLVRQLFEARGLQAWVTQASRDDGVDAVATNPDPFTGGLCVIQAKRYKGVVEVEAVRALGAVVEDMRATRGFMVTTSWYGTSSEAYAKRNERITLINGFHLKDQIKEHLGLDVLIGITNMPARVKAQATKPAN